MSVRVKTVTLATLGAELQRDIARAGDQAIRGVRAGARRGVGIVMSHTPVLTGRLRASTRAMDTPEGSDIEQPTDYAGIVDHHQGHVGDHIDEVGDAVVQEITKAVKP